MVKANETAMGVAIRKFAGPTRWLAKAVAEIEGSAALRRFGALLALTHVITFIFWTASKDLSALFGQSPSVAICWPFFEDCWRLRPLPGAFVHGALIAYGALAVGGALLFLGARLWRRGMAWAVGALLLLNVLKAAVFVLDYRLMGNYHYMIFIVSFAFLLLPNKALVCRYLIVGFYLAAGSLKLNPEWLSGAALVRPPFLTSWLGNLSLAYVVVLELLLVFGLLSTHAILFFATLAQLIIFHVYSWHIVGYFYPCIMLCLLAIFPLCFIDRVDRDMSLGARLLSLRLPRSTWLALATYAAAQVAPLFFPGDVALTGEGRLFAVNMFDAKAACSPLLIAKQGNVHTEHATLRPGLSARVRCDPIVYFNTARGLCQDLGDQGELDLGLVSRRTTDAWFQPVMSVTDFCGKKLDFDVWRHNKWMDQ